MDSIDLPALIAEARRSAVGSPLDQIEAALGFSDELQARADELVGHFVTHARHEGFSWSEIGGRLGVSKQAARQRFAAPVTSPCELPVRPRLDVWREAVRDVAHQMFPVRDEAGEQAPPESAEAKEALAGAVSLARRVGSHDVGPEHLLGALALDPGTRARRILIQMNASIPAIKRELECYISPPRRRRRRGKSRERHCSFCGKSPEIAAEMVAGPGVWICGECVALAGQILAERAVAGH